MNPYSLEVLSDEALSRDLDAEVARTCTTTASLLAHIAEFDSRKLHVPAGYPSMLAYCLDRYPFCEQATYKRIRAARSARRFPAIFPALADGRLYLSGVVLLAPH